MCVQLIVVDNFVRELSVAIPKGEPPWWHPCENSCFSGLTNDGDILSI
jgi:hypothetical protein